MSQEALEGPQIHAVPQQMGGEGVPKGVRVKPDARDPSLLAPAAHDAP